MKTSGGKISLMVCKNAIRHRSTAHMIAHMIARQTQPTGGGGGGGGAHAPLGA